MPTPLRDPEYFGDAKFTGRVTMESALGIADGGTGASAASIAR